MFGRILVPLDGSTLAERALEPALDLAAVNGGEVILLTAPVYHQYLLTSEAAYGADIPDGSFFDIRQESAAYLEQLSRIYQKPGVTIRTHVADGEAAAVILDIADDDDVDLIVMSTHGRSGVTRWLFGSVTARVLSQAPCPVLVIRHERPVQQVLITLDGSPVSELALEPGFACARPYRALVTLLHVTPVPVASDYAAPLRDNDGDMPATAFASIGHYLDDVRRRYQALHLPIETVVLTGTPAQAVLDFSETHAQDLIVMATHGHTGLRRWVFGSVTDKVMRQTHANLLIVRPPESELND